MAFVFSTSLVVAQQEWLRTAFDFLLLEAEWLRGGVYVFYVRDAINVQAPSLLKYALT